MGEFAIMLLMIALQLGLSKIQTKIDRKEAERNHVTPDQIISGVKSMISEARSKGTNVLNKLTRKLDGISIPYGLSGTIKSFITDARKNAQTELDNTNEKINKVETKLSNLEERANFIASQPDDYRTTDSAKRELNEIKDKTKEATSLVDQISKGVENKI